MSRGIALVTGATGFAGSHVVDHLLAAGLSVRVLVRSSSNLRWLEGKSVDRIEADLREPEKLRRAAEGVGAVFHFGGRITARTSREFHEANADGTESLARAFLDAGQADGSGFFLYCSSLSAGGPVPSFDRGPVPHVREDDPPRPVSPYGQSKLDGERRLEILGDRARVVIIRPPAIYGPRDEAILRFLRWIQNGWLLMPPRKGNLFSLIHIRDLARASVEAMLSSCARGIYYLSDGEPHTWQNIGQLAGSILGVRPRCIRLPLVPAYLAALLGEIAARLGGRPPLMSLGKIHEFRQRAWVCLPDKAGAEFGFRPRVTVREGMEETIRWYQSVGWLRAAR